jgi:PadR family transcriptional regulator, regulatory protein AphA
MSPRQPSALTLEHVLLALLDQHPMHGYELYQELCALEGISKIWNIKQASLYAILDKLEEYGSLSSQHIQGETYPPRKVFHLTEMGRKSLLVWIETPVRRARELRQEFLAKLIVAHRYGKPAMMALIHAQEQACQGWSAGLQAEAVALDPQHMDEWVVNTYRLNRIEAVLQWLEMCAREIEKS